MPAAASEAVEHVVALVLENRSFDHVLGDLGRSGALPLDGGRSDAVNADVNGVPIALSPVRDPATPDLPHDFESVVVSLMGGNGGFVLADQIQHRGSADVRAERVMSYYESDTLPVTHALAREYGVCDRWFASVPAGTWPNRLFLVAGTSDGRVTNTVPAGLNELATVFDRLPERQWAIYCDHIPNVGLIRSLAGEWLRNRVFGDHFRSIDDFEQDCAAARLPAFSYIEPIYLGSKADDGHPPRDMLPAERILARLYLALRRSALWNKTLFLVLYDEHGGFFDHVPPPTDVPGPDGTGERGFAFRSLGVRVPALIISPHVSRGTVWRPTEGRFVDHTSLIATVLRRWGAEPLTPRDAAAADVWPALTEPSARRDDIETLERLERWFDTQQAVVRSWQAGGVDTTPLAGRSGREIALMVVAGAEQRPDLGPLRGGAALERAVVQSSQRDVPLEDALVTLAERMLALPE